MFYMVTSLVFATRHRLNSAMTEKLPLDETLSNVSLSEGLQHVGGCIGCHDFACPATGPFCLFDPLVPSHPAIRRRPSYSHPLRTSPSH